jgi:hypothetical protein
MPLVRRLAAVCLALGLVGSGLTPAVADSAAHKLKHAQAAARRLDAAAARQARQVSTARRELATLDAQANAALEALARARAYADKTEAAHVAAQAALDAARRHTRDARRTLGDLAANAYRSQASGGSLAQTLSLVDTGNPQTFLDGVQLIGQVGRTESRALDDLRVAQAGEQIAEGQAASTAALAAQAETAAAAAKKHVDALVAQQKVVLARLTTLLAHTRAKAAAAHARARALARAIAAARARAAAIRRAQALSAARSRASGGPIPLCHGGSVSGYANGELPVAALCSLWGAPGEMLRADAAARFNRMSRAFFSAFGEPLCVTSSYRTYAHQVELYAGMPAGYAAVPGTSNHGWGLAVDLCGGIQVDGSPEHLWLLDHAAAYDWFHPGWAMPGGGGPHEPWHWEYAG